MRRVVELVETDETPTGDAYVLTDAGADAIREDTDDGSAKGSAGCGAGLMFVSGASTLDSGELSAQNAAAAHRAHDSSHLLSAC